MNTQTANGKASHARKGTVAFVSRQRLTGKTNGSSAYLLSLADATKRAGYTPILVQPSPDIMGRHPFLRMGSDMNVFAEHHIRGTMRCGPIVVTRSPKVIVAAATGLTKRFARRIGLRGAVWQDKPFPYAIATPWSDADKDFTCRHAFDADIIIADYAFQAEAFSLAPRAASAIVMHDLFHARTAGAKGVDSVTTITEEAECELLSQADAVIAIQREEAAYVERQIGVDVIMAPMSTGTVPAPQSGCGCRLLFVGSNTAPNVIGLRWFLQEVWPALLQRFPEMTLDIVGSVKDSFDTVKAANAVFHGKVENLTPYYAEAGIVISPLTFGSGLKIKLVEAMGQGKAIVATSITLQGVDDVCAEAILRADTTAEFVEAIANLRRDEARESLGIKALSVAKENFGERACQKGFIAWLDAQSSSRHLLPAFNSAA